MSSRPLLFCRPLQAEYCIIFPCFFQSYAALILHTSTPSCQELNIHLWTGQQCPNFSCQYQAGQPSLVGGNICPHLPTCSSAAPQEHVQLATGKLHLVQQFLRSSNLAPSWGYNLIVVLYRQHTGTNTWVSHAAWINSHSIWVKNQLPVESLQACCSSLYKPPDSGNACPRRDWDTWNMFFSPLSWEFEGELGADTTLGFHSRASHSSSFITSRAKVADTRLLQGSVYSSDWMRR